jgi:hypothetical protein
MIRRRGDDIVHRTVFKELIKIGISYRPDQAAL